MADSSSPPQPPQDPDAMTENEFDASIALELGWLENEVSCKRHRWQRFNRLANMLNVLQQYRAARAPSSPPPPATPSKETAEADLKPAIQNRVLYAAVDAYCSVLLRPRDTDEEKREAMRTWRAMWTAIDNYAQARYSRHQEGSTNG